jgi:hypothetical protein
MNQPSILRSGEQRFACPDCGETMIVVTDERGQPCVLGHGAPVCEAWKAARESNGGAIEAGSEDILIAAYGLRCLRAAGIGLQVIEGGKS